MLRFEKRLQLFFFIALTKYFLSFEISFFGLITFQALLSNSICYSVENYKNLWYFVDVTVIKTFLSSAFRKWMKILAENFWISTPHSLSRPDPTPHQIGREKNNFHLTWKTFHRKVRFPQKRRKKKRFEWIIFLCWVSFCWGLGGENEFSQSSITWNMFSHKMLLTKLRDDKLSWRKSIPGDFSLNLTQKHFQLVSADALPLSTFVFFSYSLSLHSRRTMQK